MIRKLVKGNFQLNVLVAAVLMTSAASADMKIASGTLLPADRTPDATLEVQVDSTANGDRALLINNSADAKNLVVVEANGDVGIGTAAPAYALDVDGTTRITTTPTIDTASNLLVKDPATGQIKEQPLEIPYIISVSNLSTALVDSVISLGNLSFRYNSNSNNDNLAVMSTDARTVQYTSYEMYGSGAGSYNATVVNLAAGAWTEQNAGGLGANEALRYTLFDHNGDFYDVELRQNNSKIYMFVQYFPNA
ncbi:hypothetical protein OAS86_07000 [Gammaproteobacteria bacterium]|nr:hypothetical protein [Gammaproteobacteria bacterium]